MSIRQTEGSSTKGERQSTFLLIKSLKNFTSRWGKKHVTEAGRCHGTKVPLDHYRKASSDLHYSFSLHNWDSSGDLPAFT